LTSTTLDRARQIVQHAHAISPSASLLRLEQQLRQGDSNARQLAKLIDGSPALAARVLRMANSAFYAPAEPVTTLSRAVALLGDTVLRQLVLTSLIVVAIAILLPFTPIGSYFGFVPPPAKFYFILGGMLMAYLVIVELAKRGFYRWAVSSNKISVVSIVGP